METATPPSPPSSDAPKTLCLHGKDLACEVVDAVRDFSCLIRYIHSFKAHTANFKRGQLQNEYVRSSIFSSSSSSRQRWL